MTIIEKTYDWNGELLERSRTDYLILHHAAAPVCSPDDIHRWHLANGWVGIGYNYFVRKDGSVYRGRPENCVGAHTVGYNSRSIGVCFEGNFQEETMPDAQFVSGLALVSDIMGRYPGLIIGGHRDFDSTACPGSNFPLGAMENYDKYENKNAAQDAAPSAQEIVEDIMSELEKIMDISGTGAECDGWAQDAADYCVENGIFCGDGSGNYGWKKPISRESAAVIIKKLKDGGDEASDWAKTATDFCAGKGIFSGDGNGKFGWRRAVTREELAAVICSVLDKLGLKDKI